MNYCLGFAYDREIKGVGVLLIRKLQPEWQNGKLNGVGGKLTDKESPIAGMVREFQEETTFITTESDWRSCGVLQGRNDAGLWNIFLFAYNATGTQRLQPEMVSPTPEKLELIRLDKLSGIKDTIPNLQWMIPFCLDEQMDKLSVWEKGTFKK